MAYESYYTNKIIKTTKAQYDALKNGESVKGYKLNEKDTFVLDIDSLYNDLNKYTQKTISIPDNTSLDTITESGFYRLSMNPNFPHAQMIVSRGADTIAQMAFPYADTKMYVRTGNPFNPSGGLWHEWKQVAFTDNIPTATAFKIGGVKSSTTGTTPNRDYKVQVNDDGTMKVNVPWTEYGDDVSALTSRMEYLISMNPTIPPIIDTNLVLSNELSITDTNLLGQIISVLTYADGTPRRTACMSFKDTGSGKITLNFTVSIYAESNAVLHYLLVSYFKDKNGIYKVYLGFKKDSGIFGHDAIKIEQYGTF